MQWSQEPDTDPDLAVDVTGTSDTSPELADGPWWLHLRTIDAAGNPSATSHFGPVVVRPPPPSTTTTSTTVGAARRTSSPTPTTGPPTTSPPPQTTTTHYHPPGHPPG